jgi:hypothetical protein
VTNFAGPSRFDGETPHYQLLIYNSFAAPVIVASGVEARLIEAEAALHANDFTTWKAKLDAARASFGMGPITDPGTTDGRVDSCSANGPSRSSGPATGSATCGAW